jgi:RNA polymerase sigma-70 factor, ECF subfamily
MVDGSRPQDRPGTSSGTKRGANVKSDEELLEQAKRGDAQAFEALYHRHRDWVYRLAWRFTGNQADALDILQETFAYLFGKLPSLRLTAAMTTFLYPVVRHLSLNLRRKRAPDRADGELLAAIPDPAPAEASRAELASALATLAADQREVVLMRFVDDMSLEEIAQALHTPLNTIKSRLYRALDALRDDPRTRDYFFGS